MKGFAGLTELRERFPDIPVVVISGRVETRLIREVMNRGASGFIPKTLSGEEILNALRRVLAGEVYLPKGALMFSFPLAGPDPAATADAEDGAARHKRIVAGGIRLGLTLRQVEVLERVLEGKPNKLISRELDLAQGTVKNHIAAILKAFNVANRTQAILVAQDLGLIARDV